VLNARARQTVCFDGNIGGNGTARAIRVYHRITRVSGVLGDD
jgi:hypothetical protein